MFLLKLSHGCSSSPPFSTFEVHSCLCARFLSMLFVCMHAPWVPLTFPHPWRNHCTRTPVCLLRASAQEPMSPKNKTVYVMKHRFCAKRCIIKLVKFSFFFIHDNLYWTEGSSEFFFSVPVVQPKCGFLCLVFVLLHHNLQFLTLQL